MVVVISVQHSRSGAGATTVGLTLTHLLLSRGRVLYVEADFLNPVIGESIGLKGCNDWIIGDSSLEEVCVDVSGIVGLLRGNFYVLPADASEDSRKKIELLDAIRDDRIIKTLERENWILDGKPVDYVVIDTPPWMNYLISSVSYISNYVLYVLKPNIFELQIFKDRLENIFSNFACLIKPIVNFYDSREERMRRFEREFKEVTDLPFIKIPYLSELSYEIDLKKIFSKQNRMQNYLVDVVREFLSRPIVHEHDIFEK
ncbi:MAG: AAA family ATPase [Nitrososphaerota archaeon]